LTTFQKLSNLKLSNLKTTHDIVSHQFRKFFQCYAMSFNKQQERTGTLFQTPFKRALVDSNNYFTQLTYYIHTNAQHHDLAKDFRDWPWSSYGSILSEKVSKLKKQEVLDWFGTKEKYKDYHAEQYQILAKDKFIFEDE
jgi:putative transposase